MCVSFKTSQECACLRRLPVCSPLNTSRKLPVRFEACHPCQISKGHFGPATQRSHACAVAASCASEISARGTGIELIKFGNALRVQGPPYAGGEFVPCNLAIHDLTGKAFDGGAVG